MLTKQEKLKQALKLQEALKQGSGEFVLLEAIDRVGEKIDAIKPTDTTDIKDQLKTIEERLEEPIEVELIIE